MAKSINKRNANIIRLYLESAGDKVGDDLFYHHLTKLEIITSHLSELSYAPNSNLASIIKNTQFLPLIGIAIEMIDKIVEQQGTQKYLMIASIWPTINRLYAGILDYEGGAEPLRKRVRLAHRAAKILLEVWSRSIQSKLVSSMYYAPSEEEFAKTLPFPISADMSISDQVAALVGNIERFLVEKD